MIFSRFFFLFFLIASAAGLPLFGPSLKKALINIQKGVFDDASLKVVKNAVNKGNGDALTILRGALTSATTGGTVASKGDMMGQFFRKKNVDWMTNEEAMIAAFGVKPEALGAAGKSSPLQSLKNWASGIKSDATLFHVKLKDLD